MQQYESNFSQQTTQTPGTLASRGLYQGLAPPRQSQARGIQGTDNRAYTRQVTNDELVRNQMNQQLADNSLYMQLNERDALRQSMSRGLGNSSIAVGAGRRAAIESAMPIAMADAATYGRTQAENMGALNENLMQERDLMNRSAIEGARIAQQSAAMAAQERMAQAEMAARMQQQRENLAFSGEQSALDRFQQQQMAQFGLGADLMRGTQQYGFQRGLNEQGYQFDLGRMGAQDYYNSLEGQRDMNRQMQLAEFGAGLNVQNAFYNMFAEDFFINPEVWADPARREMILGFGQSFRPRFQSITSSFYGAYR